MSCEQSFPQVMSIRNNLLHERKHGDRVYLGLVGGVMIGGFVRHLGNDMVVVELSEPDGQGGYTGGPDRMVTVALQHIVTLERIGG